MDIGRREQGDDLVEHVADKLERLFLAGMEREMLPFALASAGDFRIGTADSSSMARHVEFGNDHDVAIGCIGNDLLDLFLGVERSGCFRVVPVADSSFGGQLRITLDLDAPARFVGQVPVEDVQAKGRHDIQILFYLLFTEEVAALVEHETAPAVAGLILYLTGTHVTFAETGKLQKGFLRIEQAGFGRGLQQDAVRFDDKRIGFIGHLAIVCQFQTDGSTGG